MAPSDTACDVPREAGPFAIDQPVRVRYDPRSVSSPRPSPGLLGNQTAALLQRRGVRQLVKFSLVGATSTVVDKGTLWVLLNDVLPRQPWWASATISFSLAVTNGFVWNRRWTFRAQDLADTRTQYTMFLASNLLGLLLNLALTKAFLIVFTGKVLQLGEHPDPNAVLIASICAVPFVVVWNFALSKYWTFRPRSD